MMLITIMAVSYTHLDVYKRQIKDIMLQDPQAGDILAMFSTGAYHYTMASNYNQLPKPAVVFTYEGKSREVIRRQTFEDLIYYDIDSKY